VLIVFALVVVFAAGMLVVFTQTEAGRAKLAAIASGLASGPDRTVRIEGLDGLLSARRLAFASRYRARLVAAGAGGFRVRGRAASCRQHRSGAPAGGDGNGRGR
jgi:autotransporter translocation and assembly factor TamB